MKTNQPMRRYKFACGCVFNCQYNQLITDGGRKGAICKDHDQPLTHTVEECRKCGIEFEAKVYRGSARRYCEKCTNHKKNESNNRSRIRIKNRMESRLKSGVKKCAACNKYPIEPDNKMLCKHCYCGDSVTNYGDLFYAQESEFLI